jgi:hypothetical protein
VSRAKLALISLFGIDPNTNPQHLDQSPKKKKKKKKNKKNTPPPPPDPPGTFLENFPVEPFPEFRIDILQAYEKSFGIQPFL